MIRCKEDLREPLKNGPDKFTNADVDRFLAYIDDSVGLAGCWPWIGCKDRGGHGQFFLRRKNGKPYTRSANRFICRALYDEELKRKYAAHSCDNPGCTFAHHIVAETPTQNRWDYVYRGRHLKKAAASVPITIRHGGERATPDAHQNSLHSGA